MTIERLAREMTAEDYATLQRIRDCGDLTKWIPSRDEARLIQQLVDVHAASSNACQVWLHPAGRALLAGWERSQTVFAGQRDAAIRILRADVS